MENDTPGPPSKIWNFPCFFLKASLTAMKCENGGLK